MKPGVQKHTATVVLHHGLLHRVGLLAAAHAFHRHQLTAGHHGHQGDAGVEGAQAPVALGVPVHQGHGARAAVALGAALLGASEAAGTQEVEQRGVGGDAIDADRRAIELELEHIAHSPDEPPRMRGVSEGGASAVVSVSAPW